MLVGKDTDLLVMLIERSCPNLYMQFAYNAIYNSEAIREALPLGVQNHLLIARTITGCDTVSAMCNVGKKTAAEELAPVLTKLFQFSLNLGHVPRDWREARVVPIFKKGERHQPSNYRPVSLTSITCKILEHIVHSNVMGHYDRNKILTDSQHGFRKNR